MSESTQVSKKRLRGHGISKSEADELRFLTEQYMDAKREEYRILTETKSIRIKLENLIYKLTQHPK